MDKGGAKIKPFQPPLEGRNNLGESFILERAGVPAADEDGPEFAVQYFREGQRPVPPAHDLELDNVGPRVDLDAGLGGVVVATGVKYFALADPYRVLGAPPLPG